MINHKHNSAFACGWRAFLRGCKRILCNPRDQQELDDWRAGWDASRAINLNAWVLPRGVLS